MPPASAALIRSASLSAIGTSPCRPAWSYQDPADAETGRCRAREARTGTPQGLSGCAPGDRRSTPSRRALGGVPAQRIERRPTIAALSAADAMILVDLRHLRRPAQLVLLVGRGLVLRRYPQIDRSAFHGFAPLRTDEQAITGSCALTTLMAYAIFAMSKH